MTTSAESDSLALKVEGLCKALSARDRVSSGDLAELRRLDPERPPGAAFWKLALSYRLVDLDQPLDDHERRLTIVLRAMATLAGFHDPTVPLGAALAGAGFSELRFNRLLRADAARLPSAVRRMADFLASKGARADHRQIAWLVLTQDADRAEQLRRRVARDYYSTLHAASRSE